MQASIFSAKNQIAFYASTPSYLPVLKCHGLEDLQIEANKLSREGKWMELNALIDDDLLKNICGGGNANGSRGSNCRSLQG